MKKIFLSFLLMGLLVPTVAQTYPSPKVFRNYPAYVQYLAAHPERVPVKAAAPMRNLTQKLDSVVGADDFDRTRWKNCYTYPDQGKVETHYLWRESAWQPSLKTETSYGDECDTALVSRWNGETWENDQRVVTQYLLRGARKLPLLWTAEEYADTTDGSGWYGVRRTEYAYNESDQLVSILNCKGEDLGTTWTPVSRTAYSYDEAGYLVCRLSATYRNNDWVENEMDSLAYDADGHCISLLRSMKMMWFPGGGGWRVAEKHEYTYYPEGRLKSEDNYTAGWFGSEMTLESKTDYSYDANGNYVLKTVSVFNEADWIVRDVYENVFDATVSADQVLGLAEVWESTVEEGLGSELDVAMPLVNRWCNCSIASQQFDTQFTLYCSGFESVDEQQQVGMKACSDQGRLTVVCPVPTEVAVYDLAGRQVAMRSKATTCVFDLTPGLYLVRGGNEVVKVMVR